MEAAVDYKYYGLLAVCILLSGLTFVLVRWPRGKHATFSRILSAFSICIMLGIITTIIRNGGKHCQVTNKNSGQ